jgi:3-oxoadipate enol-lactonase
MTDFTRAPWAHTHQKKRVVTSDGTGLFYEIVGEGERVLLLANGLGGRLYSWSPLLDELWKEYRIVTWDYRGLFASDAPQKQTQLAVHNHIEDAATILQTEKIDKAVFFGWSMGVQVSLDLAAHYPERCIGLVLLNGTYGHVLSTGFQPVFSVPFLPKRLHAALEWFQRHPNMSRYLATFTRLTEIPAAALMSFASTSNMDFRPVLHQYFDDVLGDSFRNFLRLFQELDAHSVYHKLPEIHAPALVISGALDPLTPAYQSREIARRMPDAKRLALWRSSHFSLLERPNVVLPVVREFLDNRARW